MQALILFLLAIEEEERINEQWQVIINDTLKAPYSSSVSGGTWKKSVK